VLSSPPESRPTAFIFVSIFVECILSLQLVSVLKMNFTTGVYMVKSYQLKNRFNRKYYSVVYLSTGNDGYGGQLVDFYSEHSCHDLLLLLGGSRGAKTSHFLQIFIFLLQSF